MVRPKIKKDLDGSRQRVKASDFDNISKEILVTASSIFRCLIVTQVPIKLTPSAVKMLLRRTSHVCGELKTKMRSLARSFFGFRPSDLKEVIRQNRDLAESLKDGSSFVFKDWRSKTGIYKTELLQEGINIMWFANQNDEGIIYHKYFNPMPIEVVALVLTAVSQISLKSMALKMSDY
ncbi:hypothetical protein DFH29DRAFT_815272 [Suillus ampliporus]|nr:hypothetical protein DFH29DRAFT_815272 [Suillus ampliporus]